MKKRFLRFHTLHSLNQLTPGKLVFLLVLLAGILTLLGRSWEQDIRPLNAQTSTPSSAWITNGIVYGTAADSSGTVYIGGTFTYVGPNTGNGVPISTSTGTRASTFPVVNGAINTVISDDASGWYIGGSFTQVGSSTRNRLARILSDGTLDATWNPNANGTVETLVSDGTNVYIGGSFTTIGGSTRNRLAAVDDTTGAVTSWNPNANGTVNTIVTNPLITKLYVGGDFTTIGATTRNRIASFTLSDGVLEAWDPNVNGSVKALRVSDNGNILYAGGDFTTVGSDAAARNRAAGFNTSLSFPTNNYNSWNPNANATVEILANDGTNTYLGGSFTTLGGSTRNRIGSVSGTFGTLNDWDPNASGTVSGLALSGSTLYVGGSFTSIGGSTRNNLAAIDTSTAAASAWNPSASDAVLAVAVSGTTIYAGGSFVSVNGNIRNYIAAINPSTGQATSWDPNANGGVVTLTVSGTTVYAGGSFTSIGGASRNRLAALDTSTALASSWNPNANGTVRALVISGSTLYTGGDFTSIGGQTRNYIAAVDTSTAAASSWDPNANSSVRALVISGSTLYTGGDFTSIGGQTRNYIAALDTATGNASSWNPNSGGSVNTLVLNGSTLYVGGAFTSLGGLSRNRLAAVDTSTGSASSWDPNISGGSTPQITSMALSGSAVYIGGDFTTIGGSTTRNYLAAIDTTNASATTWNPNASAVVRTIVLTNNTLFSGGEFTTLASNLNPYLAQFGPLTIGFSSSSSSGAESTTAVSINIALSAASDQNTTVDYTVTGTSANPADHNSASGTATITAGGTTTSIDIAIVNDTSDEDDETIIITLANPSGANLTATTVHTYTITDNDDPPTISFSSATSSGAETTTPANLTIAPSVASGKTVTVDYAVTGGTATGSGTDYTLASGTATISAGGATATIPITIVNDGVDEAAETIIVTISNPNNATLGSVTSHTFTILVNNTVPTTPSITSPTAGSTVNTTTPGLASSTFSDSGGSAHKAAQWQIRIAGSDFSSPIWDSETTTTDLVSATVPVGKLSNGNIYYARVRHQDTFDGWSSWSSEVEFRSPAAGQSPASKQFQQQQQTLPPEPTPPPAPVGTKPKPPNGLKISHITTTSFTLSFAASDGETYELREVTPTAQTVRGKTTTEQTTTIIITDLEPATTYKQFVLFAVKNNLSSDGVTLDPITTLSLPAPPPAPKPQTISEPAPPAKIESPPATPEQIAQAPESTTPPPSAVLTEELTTPPEISAPLPPSEPSAESVPPPSQPEVAPPTPEFPPPPEPSPIPLRVPTSSLATITTIVTETGPNETARISIDAIVVSEGRGRLIARLTDLNEGQHRVTIEISSTNTDAPSNTVERILTIDRTPPPVPSEVVSVRSLVQSSAAGAAGAVVLPANENTIRADGDSIARLTRIAYAGTTPPGAVMVNIRIESDPQQFSCAVAGPTWSCAHDVFLPAGDHHVSVAAQDAAGNISQFVPLEEIHVAAPQCSDGQDNDGNLHIDFPRDPGCASIYDDDESSFLPPILAATVAKVTQPVTSSAPVRTVVQAKQKTDRIVAELQENPAVVRSVKENVAPLTTTASSAPFISLLAINNLGLLDIPNVLVFFFLWLLERLHLRPRRKQAGQIYDAISKHTLPMARVAVYSQKQQRFIASSIADFQGTYTLPALAPDDEYYLQISKPRYMFPTNLIRSLVDHQYEHIYRGESFIPKKVAPRFDVPLDPETTRSGHRLKTQIINMWAVLVEGFHLIANIILAAGALVSLGMYFVVPLPRHLALFGLYLVLAILSYLSHHITKRHAA